MPTPEKFIWRADGPGISKLAERLNLTRQQLTNEFAASGIELQEIRPPPAKLPATTQAVLQINPDLIFLHFLQDASSMPAILNSSLPDGLHYALDQVMVNQSQLATLDLAFMKRQLLDFITSQLQIGRAPSGNCGQLLPIIATQFNTNYRERLYYKGINPISSRPGQGQHMIWSAQFVYHGLARPLGGYIRNKFGQTFLVNAEFANLMAIKLGNRN